MAASIGTRIANERRYACLTQEELVGLIGEHNISLSTLKLIEHDEGRISLSNAMLICKALGLSISDIVDDKAELRNPIVLIEAGIIMQCKLSGSALVRINGIYDASRLSSSSSISQRITAAVSQMHR